MPHDVPQVRVECRLQAPNEDCPTPGATCSERDRAACNREVPQAHAHPAPWKGYPIGRTCTHMKVHDANGKMVLQAPVAVARQIIEAVNA